MAAQFYRCYHLPIPEPIPSTLTVLNSNFLQLGRRMVAGHGGQLTTGGYLSTVFIYLCMASTVLTFHYDNLKIKKSHAYSLVRARPSMEHIFQQPINSARSLG